MQIVLNIGRVGIHVVLFLLKIKFCKAPHFCAAIDSQNGKIGLICFIKFSPRLLIWKSRKFELAE